MKHAMHEMLEHYTPDQAAECLPYHPDPDYRIYRALYATLKSDAWTVKIRACDGSHATLYDTEPEAWAAAEKHLGRPIAEHDRTAGYFNPALVDDFGGVVTVQQINTTLHMGDIWESLPEDIQERLNAAVEKEYSR